MVLDARAIRVDDVWVVEIPEHRLRVPVGALEEVEGRVASALSVRLRRAPELIRVDISVYLHLEDSTSELSYRERAAAAVALRGSRVG